MLKLAVRKAVSTTILNPKPQTLNPKILNQAVRKAAEDALMQCYEHDSGNLEDFSSEISRIRTDLREINCQLEPGFASLIGLEALPSTPKKSGQARPGALQ